MKPTTIKEFFASLNHPLASTLRAVCATIADASPKVQGGIKWNAPSYYIGDEQYFATVNIHPRGKSNEAVMVVLHRGAKAKAGKVDVPDPRGLIEWLGKDRGAIRFRSLSEVRAAKPALRALIRHWITQL